MDSRKDILLNDVMTNKIVDVDVFLKEHSISFRTLQNDVAFLNSEMGADILELYNSKISVNNLNLFMERFEIIKEKSNPYSYKMTKEERLFIEYLLILNADNFITGNSLAEHLFISRNTVTSDINSLKTKLQKAGLKLESKTNKGHKICGDEALIRKQVYSTIMNTWKRFNEGYRQIISDTIGFDQGILDVRNKLIKFFDKNIITLDDTVFSAVYLCILFKLKRLKKGHLIIDGAGSEGGNNSAFHGLMDEVFDDSEWQAEGELTDLGDLISYLNLGKSIQENYHADDQMKISSFVWEVCKELDVLEELEYENYSKLCAHIISTVESIKMGTSSPANPVLSELKSLYPDIFEAINKHINVIEKVANRALDENDVSYIAMHVAAIMETNKAISMKLRAVLVCPNGRCMSEFLKSRLLNYFNLAIVDTIPAYKIESQNNIDIVISTVPLDNSNFPVVLVSQMLSPSDLIRIKKCIRSITKKIHKIELHQNIENYVKGYQDIIDKNANLDELKKLNRYYNEIKRPFFFDHITKKQITLDFEAGSWQEAVRESGELLKNEGYINQNYIDRMVTLVEENGPYILFMPGFALAHASPEDGASRLGVSMVRLDRPIIFEGSDISIKFIICLSITDKDSHVSLMYQIYKCLTNEELFEKLINCDTENQITELLEAFELSQVKT